MGVKQLIDIFKEPVCFDLFECFFWITNEFTTKVRLQKCASYNSALDLAVCDWQFLKRELLDAISWVILSYYTFVSQETFAYKFCTGRLTAKSVINLDTR